MLESRIWNFEAEFEIGGPLAYHCVLIQYTVSQISGVLALRRYDSDASITDSSSMVSGPQSSMLSDGRSSMVSITQGSYVPDSYLTDGYESEPYLTSIGSSASRAAFRLGKDSPKSRWEKSTFPFNCLACFLCQSLVQLLLQNYAFHWKGLCNKGTNCYCSLLSVACVQTPPLPQKKSGETTTKNNLCKCMPEHD